MDLNLHNRVALITGSTRGLGKEIALTLAQEGADILINGRDLDLVYSTSEEIRNRFNVKVYPFCCDVTDKESVKDYFSSIDRLDILVNSAGNIEKFGDFLDLDDEDWTQALDLTFLSMIRCSRGAYPCLRKSDQARIINIGSLPAHQPGFKNPHYAAAKAAMATSSKQLALRWAKDNILVNTVCPSSMDGGGWYKNILLRAQRDDISATEAEELMRAEESAKSPLGRMGTLQDTANLVAFLASNKASFITGQCIDVDGCTTRSVR